MFSRLVASTRVASFRRRTRINAWHHSPSQRRRARRSHRVQELLVGGDGLVELAVADMEERPGDRPVWRTAGSSLASRPVNAAVHRSRSPMAAVAMAIDCLGQDGERRAPMASAKSTASSAMSAPRATEERAMAMACTARTGTKTGTATLSPASHVPGGRRALTASSERLK